jgi:hypothetical protein
LALVERLFLMAEMRAATLYLAPLLLPVAVAALLEIQATNPMALWMVGQVAVLHIHLLLETEIRQS